MPFKSRRQARFAFGTHQPWAAEWASKTNFKRLPARARKRVRKDDESALDAALLHWFVAVRRDTDLVRLANVVLALGSPEQVVATFAWQGVTKADLPPQRENAVVGIVLDAAVNAAQASLPEGGLAGAFDIVNEEAARYARDHVGEMITDITASQLDVVQRVMEQAQRLGWDPARTARMLRSTIGLTPRQTVAVLNYVGPDVERFAARQLAQRCTVIARTETLTAENEGKQAVWERLMQRGYLGPGVRRRWVTAHDERTCPICAPLDGTVSPMDGTFTSEGVTVETPPAHPACRCDCVLDFGRESTV